ncbi:MAG: FAD-binding protein [Deltaproteobacteria bacterium]|nr:FAD-binding protein [Deltaproteobacteria bacterium]
MLRRERALVAAAEIGRRIGPSRVLTDEELVASYAGDESEVPPVIPAAVVRAETSDDVVATLEVASQHEVPVTPRGAGTGKSGGAIPDHGGLVLATQRIARLKQIDRANRIAIVEPGMITGELHAAVEAEGLFYPPDPNSLESCALGGNVAENAGGPRAFKYGVTREYVLGLEAVLMGGQRLSVGRRTVKGVTGYDLTALFVGSEGTLAVFTELWLRLVPRPPRTATALALFSDAAAAGRAVAAIVAAGLTPSVLELLDEESLAAIRARGAVPVPARATALLLIEVDGEAELVELELERAAEACEAAGAVEVLVAQEASQRRALWAARRELSRSLKAAHLHKIAEDIVVPRTAVPEMIARTREIGRAHGLVVATYGHAGDGNLHSNFLWDDPSLSPEVERAVEELMRLAVEMGGTLSGEHGIGLQKAPFLAYEQSPQLIDLQRQVKAVFDPKGLLNPGKIFGRSGHGAC